MLLQKSCTDDDNSLRHWVNGKIVNICGEYTSVAFDTLQHLCVYM